MSLGMLVASRNFRRYSPPSVDRIWGWVYYNKIPIYPICYLLKGDCRVSVGFIGVPRGEGGESKVKSSA